MKNLEQLVKDVLDKKVIINYPRRTGKTSFFINLQTEIWKEQIRRQNENNPTTK